jgi:membrane protease subunit (stomatin/prohibitin family)
MTLRDFIKKQFIDVIHWTEPEYGILAYRFPMQDMEIQTGGEADCQRLADGSVCE